VTDGSVTVTGRLLPRRSRKSLTVGDRFEAEYTVRHHRDTRVSPLVTQSAGDFVVTDQRLTTRYHGDTILDVYRLELAGFATSPPGDSGPGPKVPPFLVTWATGSEVWAAQSDSLPVEITSVLAEGMEDINELKPQVSVPNLLPLFIAGAVILAAALTYLGFRLYRRLRRRKAEAEPPLAPWDEALAALGALPVLEWLDKGLVKKYYYAVSEIVKRYLSRRFGFAAVDETTTEIVRELKTAKVPERDRFTEFFYGADMVKYAKYLPSKPETAVDVARDLVRATTPKPEPPRPPATDSVPGSDGRPIRPPDSGPGSTGRPIRSPAGRADGKR
jgi:hypothetical protein